MIQNVHVWEFGSGWCMRHMERDIALCTKETPTRPGQISQRNKTRFSCRKKGALSIWILMGGLKIWFSCSKVQRMWRLTPKQMMCIVLHYIEDIQHHKMTCLGSWRLCRNWRNRVYHVSCEREIVFKLFRHREQDYSKEIQRPD